MYPVPHVVEQEDQDDQLPHPSAVVYCTGLPFFASYVTEPTIMFTVMETVVCTGLVVNTVDGRGNWLPATAMFGAIWQEAPLRVNFRVEVVPLPVLPLARVAVQPVPAMATENAALARLNTEGDDVSWMTAPLVTLHVTVKPMFMELGCFPPVSSESELSELRGSAVA